MPAAPRSRVPGRHARHSQLLRQLVVRRRGNPWTDVAVLPDPISHGHRAPRAPSHDRRAADPGRRDAAARGRAADARASGRPDGGTGPWSSWRPACWARCWLPSTSSSSRPFRCSRWSGSLPGGRLLDRRAPRNALAFLAPYLLALPFVIGRRAPGRRLRRDRARRRVGVGAARRWQPRRSSSSTSPTSASPSRWRSLRSSRRTSAAGLPGRVAGRPVPDPERRAAQRHRLRHEQVLPGDVGRRGDPRGVVHPSLAEAGDGRRPGAQRPVAAARRWVDRDFTRQQVSHGRGRCGGLGREPKTPGDAVFVTDGWVNALTDSAGRKRLSTFGPYIANLGYRPDERIGDVTRDLLRRRPDRSAELMRQTVPSYVIDDGRPGPAQPGRLRRVAGLRRSSTTATASASGT